MSKIEKTLELNITHEILSLADSFWWFLQPISLKRYWRPNWSFPFIPTPKSFATGLPINLEGKKGGGYDVCINSPANFQGGNPRLLFMQFKAGVEKQFHSDKASVFFGDALKPNIHVEFDFNSNARHNQHQLLKMLATKAGNEDAVVPSPQSINQVVPFIIPEFGGSIRTTLNVATAPLFTHFTGWVNPVRISIPGQDKVVAVNLTGAACNPPGLPSATIFMVWFRFELITSTIICRDLLISPTRTGIVAVATLVPEGLAIAKDFISADVKIVGSLKF